MDDNFEDFEDFDFDSYMEESDEKWDAKMKIWKERMIIEAIEHNYNSISKYGISGLPQSEITPDRLTDLNETIIFMVSHYADREEYEKCGVLTKELKNIDVLLNGLDS